MSKRSIIEIMDDMDRLEKIEITDELADTLKDYFKDEIESENCAKNNRMVKQEEKNENVGNN